MKVNINRIYFLSRTFGLLPFRINKQNGFVEKTQKSFATFIAFGVILQGLSFWALWHLYFIIDSIFPNETVRVYVIKWELVFVFIKSLISFAFNLMHHNTAIRLINNGITFKSVLIGVYRADFSDDIFVRQYRVRFILFVVQTSISLSTVMFLEYKVTEIYTSLSWMIYTFNHISGLLLPSLFVYMGLIVNSRFLRILNDNFALLVTSMLRNSKNSGWVSKDTNSLQVVQIGIFFRQVGTVADQIFYIYGVQILLTLISSSLFALSSVSSNHWIGNKVIDEKIC